MLSATCKTQHFAGDYFIAVHEKRVVRRKECGTGMPSFGETRETRTQSASHKLYRHWKLHIQARRTHASFKAKHLYTKPNGLSLLIVVHRSITPVHSLRNLTKQKYIHTLNVVAYIYNSLTRSKELAFFNHYQSTTTGPASRGVTITQPRDWHFSLQLPIDL